MTPKGPGRFIPRADSKFDIRVIDAMLYDLNGGKTPVKSFSGNFADILTTGMHKENSQNTALTLKQALEIMSYDRLPGIDELDTIINNIDNYDNEQKNAIFALARMTMCREQALEGFDEYKLTKKDKSDFSILHQKYMNEFALTKEENHER